MKETKQNNNNKQTNKNGNQKQTNQIEIQDGRQNGSSQKWEQFDLVPGFIIYILKPQIANVAKLPINYTFI